MRLHALRFDWTGHFKRWLGLDMTLGRRGERLAARWLKRSGYRILGSNLRNRFGEVDLLAEAPDHRTIVLVEVKSSVPTPSEVEHETIDNSNRWWPEIHVNSYKQRKLVALAGQLARRFRFTQRPIRFDVVGVDMPVGSSPAVRHHVGAFESHV